MCGCRLEPGDGLDSVILVLQDEEEVPSQVCIKASTWTKRFKLTSAPFSLIMILMVGDLLRSTFLFVFPLVSLAQGHIQTKTPFCQASGMLTQTGVEIAGV